MTKKPVVDSELGEELQDARSEFWPEAVPVPGFSPGELFDRLGVMRMKWRHASDAQRRLVLEREYGSLCRLVRVYFPEVSEQLLQLTGEGNAESLEGDLKSLVAKLFRSHEIQWELEDAAEEQDRLWRAGESAAVTRLGELFSRIRDQNRQRVQLRRQINLRCRLEENSQDIKSYGRRSGDA